MRGKKLLKKMDLIIGTVVISILSLFLRRSHDVLLKHPQRILVIKLAALGDTLLLIPALRALRGAFPDAHITFIGTIINEELIQLFPQYIHEFKRFEIHQSFKHPTYFFRFIKDLRKDAPDIVFDFEQWSYITAIISALSGAPFLIGFKVHRRLRHLLYSLTVERLPKNHESENFLLLLTPIGLEHQSTELELPVSNERVEQVTNGLAQYGWKREQQLVVIHPGCGAHGFPREWPLASYCRLCKQLDETNALFFVFTGYGVEECLTKSLAFSFPNISVQWTDTKMPMLIALLSIADLVISGNNGVMHFAAALKRPQVALHGPTDSIKWGPLNQRAVIIRSTCPECPCLDLGFEYHRTDGFCMAQISVDEVLQASQKILHSQR